MTVAFSAKTILALPLSISADSTLHINGRQGS
jgi:hypothetical protein